MKSWMLSLRVGFCEKFGFGCACPTRTMPFLRRLVRGQLRSCDYLIAFARHGMRLQKNRCVIRMNEACTAQMEGIERDTEISDGWNIIDELLIGVQSTDNPPIGEHTDWLQTCGLRFAHGESPLPLEKNKYYIPITCHNNLGKKMTRKFVCLSP